MDLAIELELGRDRKSSSSSDDDSLQSWEIVKSVYENGVEDSFNNGSMNMAATAEYPRPLPDTYTNLPPSNNYNYSPLSVNINKDLSLDHLTTAFGSFKFMSETPNTPIDQNPLNFPSHFHPSSAVFQPIPRRIQKNSLCSLESDELSISPSSDHFDRAVGKPSPSNGAIPKVRSFYSGNSSNSSPERQIYEHEAGVCQNHLQPNLFYCYSCTINICVECRTIRHFLCTVTTTRKRLEEVQLQLVKEFKPPLEKNYKSLIEKSKDVDLVVSEKKGEISQFKDLISHAIVEREKVLMNSMDAVKESHFQQFQERVMTCERYIKELKEIEEHQLLYKDILEVESARKNLNVALEKLSAPLPDFQVDFTYDKQIVPAIRNQLGKVTSYLSATNSYIYHETSGYIGQRGSIVLKLCDHANNLITATNFDLKVNLVDKYNNSLRTDYVYSNGIYRIFYDPIYVVGSYYLTILIDNNLVNGRTFELVIKTKKEIRNIFGPYSVFGNYGTSDSLNKPWGVCCDNSGRVFVADRLNNRIMIYTIDGNVLGSIGLGKGDGDGQLNLPSGVCFDEVYQRIIVADKDNHRIQVFSSNGQFLFKFGKLGSENGEFNYPWDVSTNSQGFIVVSDGKNHRVQLFDRYGNYLAQFPPEKTEKEKEEERLREQELKRRFKNYKEKRGNSNDPRKPNYKINPRLKLLNLPRGVAFLPNDELLITDFDNHKIVHLDRSLQFKRHIGNNGDSPYRFYRPNGIAVDKHGRYAVSDGKNYRVQVFDSKGALTAMFGHQGSRHGDFNWPQGIAFHPNEKILVVEETTARVQAF